MKPRLVFILLGVLALNNGRSQEMQLTPIGLQLSVSTNHLGKHWGGGIRKNNPDNFELFLMQQGKGKMFGITTHKSEVESFVTDANQIEKALGSGGCTNFHREFITFLGHKCCKLNGEFPPETYIPKRSILLYIVYAHGLRYEIYADVAGRNPPPPEKDLDIQEILGSMAFMANSRKP